MKKNNYKLRFIDFFRKTEILDKYKYYLKIGFDSYDNITVEQTKKLIRLLLYLKKNKYYSNFLTHYDYSSIKKNPLDILKTLPFTDKDLIRKIYKQIFNPNCGKLYQSKRTGGTLGTPFKYFVDKESITHTWAYTYFFWSKYAGYNPGDNFTTIAGNSLHSTTNRFKENIYYFFQNNYFVSSDIISSDFSINRKKAKRSKLIFGYPSTINQLLDSIPRLPSFFPNVRAIFATSELLTANLRKNIEKSFGIKIFDMYGANDGGIISSECDIHNGYHYNMLNCFVESIKNNLGEYELYLTNLNSFSFPFVRYRIGDLGRIETSHCACGFPMNRIVDLKGRSRDLIIIKGKGIIHGSYFNSLMQEFPQIILYKIVQDEDFSLNVYIRVSDPTLFYDVEKKLRKRFSKFICSNNFSIKKLIADYTNKEKFKVIESYVDKI